MIESEDKDLITLLAPLTRTSVHTTFAPMPNNGMMNFLTKEPLEITKTEAQVKVKDLLNVLMKGKRLDKEHAMNMLESLLTKKGLHSLFMMMVGKMNMGEVASDFVTSDTLQNLFQGMPTHRIRVADATNAKVKTGQRFEVYLEDVNTNVATPIPFKTNNSILIYLWFLLHPRKMISKTMLQNRFDDFGTLAYVSYQNTKKVDECIDMYKKNPDAKGKSENGFERFFTDHKTKANEAIVEVCKALGVNPDFYTIGYDKVYNFKDDGTPIADGYDAYSLSLTPEYIIHPDILVTLKKQFAI